MTESEPPPPPAPPPPNDGLPPSLFSSLLGDEDDDMDETDLSTSLWLLRQDPTNGRNPHHHHQEEGDIIDWQERYYQLEMALHRFREHAARMREALQEKMVDLENKLADAEHRAEEAEERSRMIEKTFQNVTDQEDKLDTKKSSPDRDRVISSLEHQVEEQKRLRIQDAKKVEAKASKIKEWVTNKLKELEEQNQTLREQHKKCTEQLEILKAKSNQFSQQKSNAEVSRQVDVICAGNSVHLNNNNNNNNELAFNTYPPIGDIKKPSSWIKGQLHISPMKRLSGQKMDSTCQVSLNSRHYSDSDDQDVVQTLPSLQQSALPPIVPPHSPAFSFEKQSTPKKKHSRSLPRDAMRNVTPSQHDVKNSCCSPTVPSSSEFQRVVETEANSGANTNSTSFSTIYGSLDRKLKMLNVAGNKHWVSERRRTVQTSNDLHDYAEIYTPSQEIMSGFCHIASEQELDVRPPTPPLHRFPSWESRIYEVAVNGISLSYDALNSYSMHSGYSNKPKKQISDNYINGSFTDVSIPVYAMVKGRASQIRSIPFTGESTDSSDNEDTRVTSTHTTSGETESSASTGSPGRNTKSSLNQSPAKHTCTSPTKSVKRDTSTESVLSDDYAIPPDAFASDTYSMDSLDHGRLSSLIIEHPKKEAFEKSGYLTKLGGKLKTWRRRWFVLKNGILSYYKTQNDVGRKPQGQIQLDDVCRVNRAEGAATFEVATSKRTYYLTADSNSTMEDWIRVLQNVIRRNTTNISLSKEDNKPSIQGWLTKVKHGHSRKCWCTLVGRMFLYYKMPNDSKPLGQINMRDARVEEVLHVSDSDEEDQNDTMTKSEYTLGIFPNQQGPTYLITDGKQEMDAWLYHLTVVSCGDNLAGTQYEQLISRLMEVDGDENSVIWRHPLMLYGKENLTQPLTSLPSEQLQSEAVKLFKSIQLFISVPLDASGIDYHVALAQNALNQCLVQPELQNELLCQLMKQTSRHSYHKPGVQQLLLCATQSLFLCDTSEKLSPTSTASHDRVPPPESKLNPPPFVFIQSWQLLALAISLFVPKNRILWFLRAHLARNADPKSEAGKYAIFCQRTLERSLINGGRESKPSRMEVLSILLKNPYHHSLPHSIPVHFLNGTYQVVGFDGSTTVEEFIQTVNEEAGIRDSAQSGFALYSDDPIDKELEHCLQNVAKLCDVISKWEQALREKHLGKFESTKVVKLTYKNRLCFRQLLKAETDKERLLTAYQINEDVLNGRFPLSKELSLELAALMAQIEYGDYNGEKVRCSSGHTTPQQQVQNVLDRFYPSQYRERNGERGLLASIQEKWISLRSRSVMDCVRIYLNCARRWSLCGAKLFSAKTQLKQIEQMTVWLAVNEDCITMLDYSSLQPVMRYLYSIIVTFGGCRDDFMLVVCPADPETKVANSLDPTSANNNQVTERLLFSMAKPKVLEITLLVADYMNAMGRTSTHLSSSALNRLERIRSKYRSGAAESSMGTMQSLVEVSSRTQAAVTSDTDHTTRRGPTLTKKRAGSDCT